MGLTMALIGVLIAFSAAMVGGARNELTRTMIEQTQAHSDYSAASTKFRLIMIEIEKLKATNPTPADTAPSPLVARFVRLYADYVSERKFSKEWSDSFHPLIDAHFHAAEHYEHAQLIAEIGIVLASLGVLLGSRPAWMVSIVFAVACVGQLTRTYFHTKSEVAHSVTKVLACAAAYQDLRKAHSATNDDAAAVDALDPGGKLRATFPKTKVSTSSAPAKH